MRWTIGPRTAPGRRVTNIVMMGMGEPLYNFDIVKSALAIVMDGDALALCKRRVTLSTAGVVPMIPRAGNEIGSIAGDFAACGDATRSATRSCRSTRNIRLPN